jgi:hypothetical protein
LGRIGPAAGHVRARVRSNSRSLRRGAARAAARATLASSARCSLLALALLAGATALAAVLISAGPSPAALERAAALTGRGRHGRARASSGGDEIAAVSAFSRMTADLDARAGASRPHAAALADVSHR